MAFAPSPESWKFYSSRRSGVYLGEQFRLQLPNANLPQQYPAQFPTSGAGAQFPAGDTLALLNAFFHLRLRPDYIDPPSEFAYVELRDYLSRASLRSLPSHPANEDSDDIILVDDRRHVSDRAPAGRLEQHERVGEPGCCKALSAQAFYEYAFPQKRHESGTNADKRAIFVAAPSPGTFLSFIATVAPRSAEILREFLQNHIVFRSFCNLYCTNAKYVMEFHLPYYALRKCPQVKDKRYLHGEPLRKTARLPLAGPGYMEDYSIHQCQTSVLITGVDDFFFTSYTFVDSYHGSEQKKATYFDTLNGGGVDPASGRSLEWPFWNPREYFLVVFAVRLGQATLEWRNLICRFDRRMKCYKESISCFDNAKLECTQALQPAVDVIHDLSSCLKNTILAWQKFERGHIHWFTVTNNDGLQDSFRSARSTIEQHMIELLSYQELLEEESRRFHGMLQMMTSASALQQSTEATRLQDYMQLLTGLNFVSLDRLRISYWQS
ncbi:hypothetical protein EJ08DRAFT_311624 [Tothia fuscella]|uniref:Uncharacterized protein n=1 Tax=Tothia fuscella TaxID=1048955 RepID=A0A9P4TXG7_9PEZI|nr:hypothetical protein EJ08DRAFT_311624 [Tothia fuscella]